jgi:SAM-dependent methyltransferase
MTTISGASDTTNNQQDVPVADVRRYWQAHPLLSYEGDMSHPENFFRMLDNAKREDSETFALPYWGFDQWAGLDVLDIGCGPGWVSVQYAAGGANVTSIDLTDTAVELARKHLAIKDLSADVSVASAEDLPFPSGSFDLVVASGVLHHTPDCQRAIIEAFRVTRPGGSGKITLYRKGILHGPIIFSMVLMVMRLLGVRHPGADLANTSGNVDDFIRRYDGDDNPVGVGKSDTDWIKDLTSAGWLVLGHETHFFPMRFTPLPAVVRKMTHRFFDRYFGTMAYFKLRKPDNTDGV